MHHCTKPALAKWVTEYLIYQGLGVLSAKMKCNCYEVKVQRPYTHR